MKTWKKQLSKILWSCFSWQELLQKAWLCCRPCSGPLALTATWIVFSIKQSCRVVEWFSFHFYIFFFPGKKLCEMELACELLSLCPALGHCWGGLPVTPHSALAGAVSLLWKAFIPGTPERHFSCPWETLPRWGLVCLMHVALLQLRVNSAHLEEDVGHRESWREQKVEGSSLWNWRCTSPCTKSWMIL